MDTTSLFTAALGLPPPWEVVEMRFAPEAGEIHFEVACTAKRLACPACGAREQPIHDRKACRWQHLHFFQYRAFIEAGVPRVACGGCGKTPQVTMSYSVTVAAVNTHSHRVCWRCGQGVSSACSNSLSNTAWINSSSAGASAPAASCRV